MSAHNDHPRLRVPLVVPGTRPELQAIEARISAERGRISPLYQVLLNSVPIANGWEAMLTAVRNRTSVPADLRELIILRVAVLNRAGYEFDAHVPHAQQAGLSDAQIEAVRQPQVAELFGPREREVLALTDHMTRDVQVPDELMDRLGQRHSPAELVELVATVAAYNMVSRFLVALGIGH
jgi:AhpD family alkylhydroperoxidase